MIILNFICLILNIFFVTKYLHIYQLKDYKYLRYFKFFIKNKHFYPIFNAFLLVLQIFLNNFLFLLLSNCFIILFNFIINKKIISSNKTPLNATNKIKRLFILSSIILFIIFFLPYSVCLSNLSLIFLPLVTNTINIYDKIKNKNFIKSAQKKLINSNCKIIAITGSNGKTSVKNILLKMLSSTYKTQASPKSFNTPLGISKFINEEVKKETEFIILEYGARHKKDIKNLCKIFGADYGIITTISAQHLETFKAIENVFKAKQELSKFLHKCFCIYNIDNLYTYRMFAEKENCKISASIFTNANVYANDIYIKNFTTHFTLNTPTISIKTKTKLLGRHNVLNIVLATALALHLKVPIEKILQAIKNLEPTPHRLEYIKSRINILDDSYNCSISSATEALKVLQSCPNNKIIATPGIIEGGKNQYSINYELGKICSVCDTCIIIGNENKKAILDGLKSQNYNFKNIIICHNLEQAKTHFANLNNGDTLLLLNDLPDDYS